MMNIEMDVTKVAIALKSEYLRRVLSNIVALPDF